MSVDNFSPRGDNLDRDGTNEKYEVWHVDKEHPVNDPACKHYFVKDSDEVGGRVAWVCKHCRRGTFLAKGQTIINS